ncbi:Predicted esterase of the alpha/beta hydrolase fold [Alysiella filiformis DSM 16848]|uniref:Predicted esterase of the alpha/beta hydrolase fold n=2 Tax=Alysiella TaxID=194195 RepID=A0A286E2C5_9NEIS|nr:Predicted esterase of the alpha/beta hydrolase fold [Alysiella filiformis DSM 16848]
MQDVGLLLVHDPQQNTPWLHTWAHGYPETVQVDVLTPAAHDEAVYTQWQQQIQAACTQLPTDQIALIAHGKGVAATLAWYDQLHMAQHRKVAAILLIAPIYADLMHGKMAEVAQRTRFTPKTALIFNRDDNPSCPPDWAQNQALVWQARPFPISHAQHRLHTDPNFEWGRILLQEMLL